jgi:hypothetical protein
VGILSVGVLLVGLAAAGCLSVLAAAERPWLVTAARVLYAIGLGASLLATAAIFSAANSNPNHLLRPTRSGWWAYVAIGALPMLIVSTLAVRRAYTDPRRRIAVLVADGLAAVTFVLVPFAFEPVGRPLHGLSLWVHQHHALVVLLLLVPSALLLLAEVNLTFAAKPGFARLRR